MNVKLRVMAGTHTGKLIPVAGPTLLIGRSEECHIRAGSEMISRQHCEITISDSTISIRDFGSRNGTYVNGQKIEGVQTLKAGDQLKAGPLEFELVVEYAEKAKKRPPVRDMSDVVQRTAQTPRGGASDQDITDWLGEPEPPSSGRWITRTTSDTHAATPTADTVAENAPAEQDPAITKSTGGKLPKVEAPKAKDSREAAINVLRILAKRKPGS